MSGKKALILDRRIEIRASKIHGFGVFANDFIPKDAVIEEAYGLSFKGFNAPSNPLSDLVKKYYFMANDLNWIATGFASIYNHSNAPNVKYGLMLNKFWVFITIKDVQKDEELYIDYGPKYKWET